MLDRALHRLAPAAVAASAALVLAVAAAVAVREDDAATQFMALAIGLAGAAGAIVAWRLDPVWFVTGALLLSVFSGNWDQFGVPIGLDRILMLPGLAIAAVRAFERRHELQLRVTHVHWLILVVAVYAIGSAIFADTLRQREPMFALLDKLGIVPFLLFALAPVLFGTERQRRILLSGLVLLGAYLGLTALFETVGADALVVPSFINDENLGIHVDRARGPFLEAAANGLALFACFIASAIAVATWRDPRARVVAGAVALLCVLGILFTLTRQAWLGATVATVVTMLIVPGLRRWLVPVIAVGAIAVFGAFTLSSDLSGRLSERAQSQSPVWDRLNSAEAALNMIDAKPLFGVGWYRWTEESTRYYRLADDYPLTTVGRPHNVFLGWAAELGLVGALLWILAFLAAVGGAIVRRGPPELRPWRIGLIALTINWLVVANFTPLGYALPNYLIWLWAGVASVAWLAPGTRTRETA